MQIIKESIGKLNDILKISLKPEDYKVKVDETLKKTKRSVQMPGFRPGHVPEGLVRKMYGKSILAEELNKIVSESLENYIKESKLELLGHPLPYKNGDDKNNFENPGDFEFAFEVGLSPQFELKLPPKHTFPYYEIEVDDKKADTYVDDVRKRYGNHTTPEIADENSVLYASFTEVDKNNQPVEKGISTTTTLAIDLVKSKPIQKKLIGIKKDDKVIIDLVKAMDDETELSYMLNLSKDKIKEIRNDFEVKVNNVSKVDKAELNQELFDKVYGKDNVKTIGEFRARVKDEISGMFKVESDRKLHHDIEDELLHSLKIELPDDFLKRWLVDVNEKPITPEQVEKEYAAYSRGMKWKLIENRIINENKIEITREEIENYSKHFIVNQFAQYGNSFLTDEMVADLSKRYLSKEENVRKIIESLSERKVFNYLDSVVKKDVKKVSYDEFIKIVREHHHNH